MERSGLERVGVGDCRQEGAPNKAIFSWCLPSSPLVLSSSNYWLLPSPISMQRGHSSPPLAPGHWIRYLRYGVRGSGARRPLTPWIIWDSSSPAWERWKQIKHPEISRNKPGSLHLQTSPDLLICSSFSVYYLWIVTHTHTSLSQSWNEPCPRSTYY